MFTGLIEDIGTVVKMEKRGEGGLITISHSSVLDDLKLGDSVSVDGVCLTVTHLSTQGFSVEASAATIGLAISQIIQVRYGHCWQAEYNVDLRTAHKPSDSKHLQPFRMCCRQDDLFQQEA